MKIICIGDSITYGYGITLSSCWVRLLEKKTGLKTVNCGTNGDTAGYILQRIKQTVVPELVQKGDIAVVMGGANDTLMYGATETDAELIVKSVAELTAAGAAVLVGIEPGFYISDHPFYGPLDLAALNDDFDAFAGCLTEKCRTGSIPYFDLRPVFAGKPELFADGIHPNEKGHELIAEKVYETLMTGHPVIK